MRKNFMVDKDPQKLSIVYDKLNHYTKIFLKCAKKLIINETKELNDQIKNNKI
jgi:hypothetical protein